MTLKEEIILQYQRAGDSGLTDYELCNIISGRPDSTVRGARKRLETEGRIRKIAEEPNAAGYACGVYALVKG